ncbi:branched-chain amino acid transport system substrate-binding protein [Desulfonauticus submarinus]|uniref:Branched-chain amino acid transport system substrate-binding protein n=2 Tax=Desulfonauticus submarinus TaxID=206665 RepID=A0A1H0AC40_9BACT|nr:branched-chain amino acid transport system substrate-binding protein [Desulfonauticus submarinus]
MGKLGKIVGMVALFCFLTSLAWAGDTIKIGVAGSHSGDLASYGIPTVNAAKLVVEKYNNKGGVLGKKIELIVADEQCKPELATNVATKLVSDGVVGVIGHICSGATKAALPIYKSAKVVVISPSATNPDLTESGKYPNFFRTIAPDDAQAKLDVEFVLNNLHAKKIAIIHDKGDYGKGLATMEKKFIEESGKAKVVLFEGVTPGAVDYSAVVQKIKRKKPDVVMFGGYHPEASKIVSTMRRKRLKIPFIAGDGVKDIAFIKVAGKSAEGVYASGPKDVSGNPEYKEALAEHKKVFGSAPGPFFENGYAAIEALLNAIEKAGSTKYEDIVKALRTEYVSTPLGKIKFDQRGDAEGVGFSVYQVRNGKFVEVK